MLGLKLNHVSKRCPWWLMPQVNILHYPMILLESLAFMKLLSGIFYLRCSLLSKFKIQIQIQNRFIVRCTKYTIQKHINIQGKTFWNNILRIWYTDMTYDRHWMWRKLLRFRERYLRFNGLRRDLHTRNQHCHDTKCRPFNARRTKTY